MNFFLQCVFFQKKKIKTKNFETENSYSLKLNSLKVGCHSYRKNLKFCTYSGYKLALLINHRFLTKRLSIIFFFFKYKLMRVESRVVPPFIAKRVAGIYRGARIGLLFVKWRRIKHEAARARIFLVRSRARFHVLRCTSTDLHSTYARVSVHARAERGRWSS